MKTRPYRIINSTERQHIYDYFSAQLKPWNNDYARFPLSASLATSPSITGHCILYTDTDAPLVWVLSDDIRQLETIALGTPSQLFSTIQDRYLISLLQALFQKETITPSQDQTQPEHILYTGAPSLLLTLSYTTQSIRMLLHPEWLLQHIPPLQSRATPLHPVQAASEQATITCDVVLSPCTLPLAALQHLKPGDVIQTDHALQDPVILTLAGGDVLGHALFGIHAQHKSIQLCKKRS